MALGCHACTRTGAQATAAADTSPATHCLCGLPPAVICVCVEGGLQSEGEATWAALRPD